MLWLLLFDVVFVCVWCGVFWLMFVVVVIVDGCVLFDVVFFVWLVFVVVVTV